MNSLYSPESLCSTEISEPIEFEIAATVLISSSLSVRSFCDNGVLNSTVHQ